MGDLDAAVHFRRPRPQDPNLPLSTNLPVQDDSAVRHGSHHASVQTAGSQWRPLKRLRSNSETASLEGQTRISLPEVTENVKASKDLVGLGKLMQNGIVYRLRSTRDVETVVMIKEQDLQQGKKEANILHELRHRNIICLREVAEIESGLCLELD